MATLFKRNGSFYGTFNHAGRRIRVKLSNNRATAKLLLADAILKAERGELPGLKQTSHNLNACISQFLQHVKASHRLTTASRYTAALCHLQRFLSKEKISTINELGAEHIERFKEWRKTTPVGHKGSLAGKRRLPRTRTINNELGVIRILLNYAIRIGKLEKNPSQGIKPLREDDARARRFLSDDESARLLENCDRDFYPIAFFLLSTGCRRGEVQHLEWGDLDLEARVIHIRAKSFWKPKSGERSVPITSNLLEVLSNLPKAGRFVFSDTSVPRPKNWFGRKLKRAAHHTGIYGLRLHDLRHSYASRAIANGMSVFVLQRILGHSEIDTTSGYVHLFPENVAKEMERIAIPIKAERAIANE